MSSSKSISFYLSWILIVNCLFLYEIVHSEPMDNADLIPLNAYRAMLDKESETSLENLDSNHNENSLLNELISNYLMAQKKAEQQRRYREMAKTYSQLNKRNCILNAGMGQNCDFKELVSAVKARKFWESTHGPGKRRKRSLIRNVN